MTSSNQCAHLCDEQEDCNAFWFTADSGSYWASYTTVHCMISSFDKYSTYESSNWNEVNEKIVGVKCDFESKYGDSGMSPLAGTHPTTHYWSTCSSDRGEQCNGSYWAPMQCYNDGSNCHCVDKHGAKVPDSDGDGSIVCENGKVVSVLIFHFNHIFRSSDTRGRARSMEASPRALRNVLWNTRFDLLVGRKNVWRCIRYRNKEWFEKGPIPDW